MNLDSGIIMASDLSRKKKFLVVEDTDQISKPSTCRVYDMKRLAASEYQDLQKRRNTNTKVVSGNRIAEELVTIFVQE